MRMLAEFKVLSFLFLVSIRWNKEGAESKISFLLPQEFQSFPSDLPQAKWCNLICVECLQMIKPLVVGFCSIGDLCYPR